MSVFGDTKSECGKMRTKITPNTENFHAVLVMKKETVAAEMAVRTVVRNVLLAEVIVVMVRSVKIIGNTKILAS